MHQPIELCSENLYNRHEMFYLHDNLIYLTDLGQLLLRKVLRKSTIFPHPPHPLSSRVKWSVGGAPVLQVPSELALPGGPGGSGQVADGC